VHRPELAIAPEILERYAGSYRVNPGLTFSFTRDGARIFSQMNNGMKFEMLGEGEKQFLLKTDGIQVTFEVDGKGRGVAATVVQNGRVTKVKRVN
jgi:hypothetical protein